MNWIVTSWSYIGNVTLAHLRQCHWQYMTMWNQFSSCTVKPAQKDHCRDRVKVVSWAGGLIRQIKMKFCQMWLLRGVLIWREVLISRGLIEQVSLYSSKRLYYREILHILFSRRESVSLYQASRKIMVWQLCLEWLVLKEGETWKEFWFKHNLFTDQYTELKCSYIALCTMSVVLWICEPEHIFKTQDL